MQKIGIILHAGILILTSYALEIKESTHTLNSPVSFSANWEDV